MARNENAPVLIAGAGPTGMIAALELRRWKIPVRIVDESEAPATTSRAIGIQARTLEELELRGLADELVRRGNPARGGKIYGGGKLIFSLDFTRIESRYNSLLFVSQAETERILREALEREGVVIERGVKMAGFAQTAEGITATLEHRNERLEKAEAAYLISAEGAHSGVRSSLDLPFRGKSFEERFALGDLMIDGDLTDAEFHIFTSEEGFLALFPLGGNHFRLIAASPGHASADNAPPTLAELQAIYDQRAHIPARLRGLGWSSWFHIASRMVSRLRIGRVFLAGDAAHIHSPAGAQGMNTGMQDMMNLGWKLAMVLQGKASERLLDTYEDDRLPVMRSVLTRTEALTDAIASQNPVVRGAFNHLGGWLAGADVVQQAAASRITQIALNYRSSTLSENHATGGSLHAGDRVPELRVMAIGPGGQRHETRLADLLDPSRFTLLVISPGRASELHAQAMNSIEAWHDLIVVEQVEAAEGQEHRRYRENFGTLPSLVLIRPDAYIGFRGGEHSVSHLANYCRAWLARGQRQQAA